MPALQPPKLLCIGDDQRFAKLVDRSLQAAPMGGQVRHVQRIDEALESLSNESFDAVLLDVDMDGADQAGGADAIHDACGQTPLMLASDDHPPKPPRSTSRIARLAKNQVSQEQLARELLQLCARNEVRLQRILRDGLQRLMPPEPEAAPELTRCCARIQLLPVIDGLPGEPLPAVVCGVSGEQLQLQMKPTSLPAQVVIGHQRRFELFRIIRQEPAADASQLLLQRESIEQLLPAEQRAPELRGPRVLLGLPGQAADAWLQAGVLQAVPVDRILTCPRCRALPSLRPGCRCCGSPWLRTPQMIHHYACACVAPQSEFQQGASLACPKCLCGGLVLGADCEQMPGQSTCTACGWQDTEQTLYGRCLQCAHVFPVDEATEEEVIRFDVERLDPLDLVTAS